MWSSHSGSRSVALRSQLCVCKRPRTASVLERPSPGWHWAAQLYPPPAHHLCTEQTRCRCGYKGKHTLMCTFTFKYLRSFSKTDFINPFLSLSLANMSSDRAVFIAYSSALVMRVMELRRRQGTRNTPFLSAARVCPLPVSEALSLFGVQGRICILSSRGRTFSRI